MTMGPGGFCDADAETVLLRHRAAVAVVMVCGGSQGHGYSVAGTNMGALYHVPKMLESMAAAIRADLANMPSDSSSSSADPTS